MYMLWLTAGAVLCFVFLLSLSARAEEAGKPLPADQRVGLATPETAHAPEKKTPDYVEGEALVKYRRPSLDLATATGVAAADTTLAHHSASAVRHFPRYNLTHVRSTTLSTPQLVSSLRYDPRVEYAEPNFIQTVAVVPNDPSFAPLWGLHNTGQTVNGVSGSRDADIDAPKAWNVGTGSSSIVVAVLDTGLAMNQAEFASRVKPGWDFVDDDDVPEDPHGHGTHVAGTIGAAGNNSRGITGVNWKVKIMPVRVGDRDGLIAGSTFIEGVEFSIDKGVDIINYSASGSSPSSAQRDVIERAGDEGILLVAAAGNQGQNNDTKNAYPADYNLDNIIAVAATDQDDALASFSNYGAKSVDLGAPGVNIYSTYPYAALTEDFESGGGLFTESGASSFWALGVTGTGNTVAIGDDQFEPYRDNAEGFLTSAVINASGQDSVILQYDYRVETESCDPTAYDYLSVSVFNGSQWRQVQRHCGSLTSGTLRLDISNYANANLKARFKWVSDNSLNDFYGAHIDNVMVVFPLASNGNYAFLNGTSMATPHVSGVAALLKSERPYLNPTQLKKVILDNVDVKSSLDGKVVTEGRLNAERTLLNGNDATLPLHPTAKFSSGVRIYSNCLFRRQYDPSAPHSDRQVCFRWDKPTVTADRVGYLVKYSTNSSSDARRGDFQTSRFFKSPFISRTTAKTYYLYVRAVYADGTVSRQIRTSYIFRP